MSRQLDVGAMSPWLFVSGPDNTYESIALSMMSIQKPSYAGFTAANPT